MQLAFRLAHSRRKFVKVYKSTNSRFAREVIERIGAIYAIEAEIRGTSAQQRLEARQAKSRPLMNALKTRLTEVVGQFSSQSPLAEAINYRWAGGGRLQHGRAFNTPDRIGKKLCKVADYAQSSARLSTDRPFRRQRTAHNIRGSEGIASADPKLGTARGWLR
jgi:Transposase IS66 family